MKYIVFIYVNVNIYVNIYVNLVCIYLHTVNKYILPSTNLVIALAIKIHFRNQT